jgi:hypothetical protein
MWKNPLDWSGRAMARSGLRMMPTFPLPSLEFRTAGFPQYGLKAGLSDKACPLDASRASLGLPSSFVLPASPVRSHVLCRGTVRAGAPPFERLCCFTPGALAPVRVVLSRSIYA